MCTKTKEKKPQELVATPEHGFSPTLIKAQADYSHSTLTAWAFVTLCTASFYLGPLILLSPLFLYKFHPQTATLLFATNLFLAFYPLSPWPRIRKTCQLFYSIFNFHHNISPKLNDIAHEQNRLSIIAMHPHAIIPIHGFIWGGICDQLLPDLYGYGCTTDGALILPILRHLLHWISAGSAKKQKVLQEMQTNGQNLFIFPGGVAEIYLSKRRMQPNDRTVENVQTIKAKRYGLMKLALQTGAVIYPGFVFGMSDILDQLASTDGCGSSSKYADESSNSNSNSDDTSSSKNESSKNDSRSKDKSKLGNVMEAISRKIGGGLTLYYGQYYLPIPYNPQLSMVLGNPIYPVVMDENENRNDATAMKNRCGDKVTCPRIENPTEEQVQELMGKYTHALECLFEQYKEQAGYPNERMEII